VVVMDAQGVTHDYVFKARSARHAEREARECISQNEWATTLIEISRSSTTQGQQGFVDCLLSPRSPSLES
jgi:hypothetical protein